MSELNWRAVNGVTGEKCPHAHHSQQSAKECAKVKGWERFYIEKYNAGRQRPTAEHMGSKRNKKRDGYTKRIGKMLATQVNNEEVEIMIGREE